MTEYSMGVENGREVACEIAFKVGYLNGLTEGCYLRNHLQFGSIAA